MTIPGAYDPVLVGLSILVAILASYSALDIAGRLGAVKGTTRLVWLAAAATAAGGAIWSMHFVGMLAFKMPMPVRYDLGITLASLAVPIVVTGAGLLIIARDQLIWPRLAVGGLVMGLGIVSMHYLGMAGMEMDAEIEYDPWLVAASVGIAVAAATAALWLLSERRSLGKKIASACAMGGAIAGMHYTAMAAATFVMTQPHPVPHAQIATSSRLGVGIAATTILILFFALVVSHLEKRLLTAEAEREAEHRLTSIAANLPGVVYQLMLHPDGRVAYSYVGGGVDWLLGRRSDTAQPDLRDVWNMLSAEDQRRWRTAMDRSAASLGPLSFAGRLRLPDGDAKWIRSQARPHRRADGTVVWDGVVLDITEARQAEEARRRSEEQLLLALEATELGTWSWDLAQGGISGSGRTKAIFGLAPDQDLDLDSFLPLIHAEDRDRVRGLIDQALVPGEPGTYEAEYRIRSGDGFRWVAARGQVFYEPTPAGGGRPARLVGTLQDITVRKRAEEQLKASLAEKEMLLSEVHHRVRNNLQVIMSLMRLEAGGITDPTARERMDQVAQRIGALGRIHEQLYRFGHFGLIDVKSYLEELCGSLSTLHPGGVTIDVDAEPMHCSLETAIPLGLIANELITNSLKHAFPNGQPGRVRVSAKRMSDTVELQVEDDGVGAAGDGAGGIGKRLVAALATQIDAEISHRSPGDGSAVALRIDAARFAETPPAAAAPQGAALYG